MFQSDLNQHSSVLFHSVELKINAIAFDSLFFLTIGDIAIKAEFPGQTSTLTLSQYCLMLNDQ